MWVNNETGIIQPIEELIEITHQNNSIFFIDATQAVGKIPIDVYDLDIDLLCFSSHKFYGPKRIGGLFVKKRIKIETQTHGGISDGELYTILTNKAAKGKKLVLWRL